MFHYGFPVLIVTAILLTNAAHTTFLRWKIERSKFSLRKKRKWRHFFQVFLLGPKLVNVTLTALDPHKRQIQRRIVKYHNYFRANVIPSAANMLRMVRQYLTLLWACMNNCILFIDETEICHIHCKTIERNSYIGCSEISVLQFNNRSYD